jgi:hypothetical protein
MSTRLRQLWGGHQPSQRLLGPQQRKHGACCLEVRKLENKLYGLEFHHVIRENNVAADVLSKLGSSRHREYY